EDDSSDILTYDLPFPASTSAKVIAQQYRATLSAALAKKTPAQMTVVFSTYQSLDSVAQAQKAGLPTFDLIICDEAHRTTGVTLNGEEENQFGKVPDAKFPKGKKPL